MSAPEDFIEQPKKVADFVKLLKEREWDFGVKEIINQRWDAGEEKTVVDREVSLGLLVAFKLVVDSPNWRIRLELTSVNKIVPIVETIAELVDEGEVSPTPGLSIWATSNVDKSIYVARLAANPPFPFKRITLRLRNESGAESTIKRMYLIWLEVQAHGG